MTAKQKVGKWFFKNMPFSRHVFDHIRAEINALYVRALHTISPFYFIKIKKLKEKKYILANLGCGPYGLPGEWINLDLFPIKNIYLRTDCRKKLPFADNSCKGIHAEMFVEHLDPCDELPYFLNDCYRSLETDEVLRVIVPNAKLFIEAYLSEGWYDFNKISYGFEDWSNMYTTKMEALNYVFQQGYEHYGGWDKERMLSVLQKAGFNKINFVSYGIGDFPGGAIDREYHKQNGLYAEAIK